MVREILGALAEARMVLDCTLGGGGHSQSLLERGATVTATDKDPDAIRQARTRLREFEIAGRFRAIQADFTRIDTVAELVGQHFDGKVWPVDINSLAVRVDQPTEADAVCNPLFHLRL